LCVQWKDGSTSWQSLEDLKEACPVAVAEYAVAQGIDNDPAFNWWVHAVLHKHKRMIALVKKWLCIRATYSMLKNVLVNKTN